MTASWPPRGQHVLEHVQYCTEVTGARARPEQASQTYIVNMHAAFLRGRAMRHHITKVRQCEKKELNPSYRECSAPDCKLDPRAAAGACMSVVDPRTKAGCLHTL